MDINGKYDDGNTLLHLILLEEYHDVEGIEFLFEHGIRLTRNYQGQSVLHFAARYSPFVLQVVDKLLEYKASALEIDNQGSTVLHEVLKNPCVTLEVIENLLEYGAHPDFCDNTGKPPLAYCESSSLQPDEKIQAEKIFIQYSIGKKIDELISNEFEDLNSFFCFNFVEKSEKLNSWTDILNSCKFEILKMRTVRLENSFKFSVYDLLVEHFHFLQIPTESRPIIRYAEKDDLIVIFSELRKYEYPVFRNVCINELEIYPLGCFIEKIKWCSTNKIMLNTDCVKKICSFLSKRDIVNLLLV